MKFQAYFTTKGYAEAIQTNFKSKLPTTEDEELDISINIGKGMKLAKIKNVMVMSYATQCLSSANESNNE